MTDALRDDLADRVAESVRHALRLVGHARFPVGCARRQRHIYGHNLSSQWIQRDHSPERKWFALRWSHVQPAFDYRLRFFHHDRARLYDTPHEFNVEMQAEAWAWLRRWL